MEADAAVMIRCAEDFLHVNFTCSKIQICRLLDGEYMERISSMACGQVAKNWFVFPTSEILLQKSQSLDMERWACRLFFCGETSFFIFCLMGR